VVTAGRPRGEAIRRGKTPKAQPWRSRRRTKFFVEYSPRDAVGRRARSCVPVFAAFGAISCVFAPGLRN
jgi:hypothetical protein